MSQENTFGLEYTGLPIRKITVGHRLKEDMSYVVGMRLNAANARLESISFNEIYFYKYGKVKYDLMVMPNGGGDLVPWKSVVDCPVVIEYDLDWESKAI